MSHRAVVALIALTIACPMSAQRLEQTRVAAHRDQVAFAADARSGGRSTIALTDDIRRATGDAERRPSVPAMVVLGTVLGAAGLFAGGALGYTAENCSHGGGEFCGLGGMILGGLVGESFGIPLGVHLAGGRGPLGGEIFTSLLVSAAGLGTAFVTQGVGILLVPPVQLITSIAMERNAKK